MAPHLRVFSETAEPRFAAQDPSVRISLEDLLPLLAIAKKHNYLWLQDFLEDEVLVTPDLYDILRAFRQVRRPSA